MEKDASRLRIRLLSPPPLSGGGCPGRGGRGRRVDRRSRQNYRAEQSDGVDLSCGALRRRERHPLPALPDHPPPPSGGGEGKGLHGREGHASHPVFTSSCWASARPAWFDCESYSAVGNWVYMNRLNTQTTSDCVIARSEATWQSRRPHGLPRRFAPRNDDGFDPGVS